MPCPSRKLLIRIRSSQVTIDAAVLTRSAEGRKMDAILFLSPSWMKRCGDTTHGAVVLVP